MSPNVIPVAQPHDEAGLGTRRERYPVLRRDVRGPRLVVAQDDAVGAELAEILHEVVDEAVVVVDNQDPDRALSVSGMRSRAAGTRQPCDCFPI
jgi:hypothetical protein